MTLVYGHLQFAPDSQTGSHWDGSPRIDVDRGPLAGHVSGSYGSTWLLFFTFSFTWKA